MPATKKKAGLSWPQITNNMSLVEKGRILGLQRQGCMFLWQSDTLLAYVDKNKKLCVENKDLTGATLKIERCGSRFKVVTTTTDGQTTEVILG